MSAPPKWLGLIASGMGIAGGFMVLLHGHWYGVLVIIAAIALAVVAEKYGR